MFKKDLAQFSKYEVFLISPRHGDLSSRVYEERHETVNQHEKEPLLFFKK